MSENIQIRMANIGDIPALIDVGDALFDHAIKPARATEFINDNRHHLILAFSDGKVIGMISGLHYVHPDKDPALFITEAGVLEAFQNCGIGRALVNAMKAHATSLGCTDIWTATEPTNIPAQKCYKAAGGYEDDEQAVVFNFESE